MTARRDVCLVLGYRKGRHRALVAIARATGLPVAVMQPEGRVNPDPYADHVIDGDEDHPARALEAVERWCAGCGRRLAAVVPLTEMTVTSAHLIAATLGLRRLGDETARLVRDKRLMKDAFRKAGVKTPGFRQFSSLGELLALGGTIGWPLIVKPSNAGGSEGVRLVGGETEAAAAYDALVRAVGGNAARHGLDERAFQAEEYIEAERELSVEIVNTPHARYACSVTRKVLTPPPYFAELGHVTAAPGQADGLYVTTALNACRALGLDRGVAHVEMRLPADGKPSVLEVNARLPGDFITEIVEHATGLNLFELHAACFLRDDVEARPLPLGQAAIAFIKAKEGEIAAVRLPRAEALPPGLVALKVFARPGDRVGPTIDSNTRGQAVIELLAGDGEADPQALAAELGERIFEIREGALAEH